MGEGSAKVVWECALRGAGRRPIEEVVDLCEVLSEKSTKTPPKLPVTAARRRGLPTAWSR